VSRGLQPLQRLSKLSHAEILGAASAFHAIHERRQLNQFAARIHKVQIKHFLSCHDLILRDLLSAGQQYSAAFGL
jgi:hypothetical protein